MSESKSETLHQKQTKNQPDLLASIEDCLTGDVKQTALDFVEYCNENKMRIRWGATNQWYIYFKSKHIASIKLRFKGGHLGKTIIYSDNSCIIQLSYLNAENPAFESFIKNEQLSEVIWKNVKYCEGCLPCAPGRDITILGKPFRNVGNGCGSIWFKNPDDESLDCIEKLLDIRRTELKNGVASGIFYR